MMKDVIDELTNYIEHRTYVDVLQTLHNEENALQKYDNALSDKIDKDVRNSIAKIYDDIYSSVLNGCYIAFRLSKKERDEIVSRLKMEKILNERT